MALLNVLDLIKGAQVLEQKVSLVLGYSGLRLPQFRALDYIEQSRQVTVSDVSRQLDVTRATASTLVTELVNHGLLRATDNPGDRRSFHLTLTDAGHHKLSVGRRDLYGVLKNISERYSDDTIAALNEFSRMTRWGLVSGDTDKPAP